MVMNEPNLVVESSVRETEARIATDTANPIVQEPPPYAEIVPRNEESGPPSIVEPLPQYTRSPLEQFELDPPTLKKSLFKRHRRWIFPLSLLMVAIIGGTVAGVIHNSQAEAADDTVVSVIVALATADCNDATILLYQDNALDIYITGTLKSGSWNNTESLDIPPTKLDFSSPNPVSPMSSTDMTSVCFSSAKSSTVEVYIFYLNNFSTQYHIISANLSFPISPPTLLPSPLPLTTTLLQNTTNASSIAATIYPSTNQSSTSSPEIHLYYFDYVSPYVWASLFELIWSPQKGWSNPNDTGATAYNTIIPLAVALVQPSSSSSISIQLFFTNIFHDLGTIVKTSSGWGKETSVLASSSNGIATAISIFAACSWPLSANILLFYISSNRPEYVSISQTTNSMYTVSVPVGSNYGNYLADAVQSPPLVACVSGTSEGTGNGNSTGDGEGMRLFYIVSTGFFSGRFIANESLANSSASWQNEGGWIVDGTVS